MPVPKIFGNPSRLSARRSAFAGFAQEMHCYSLNVSAAKIVHRRPE